MSIPFQRHLLSNGLRVIVHEDATTPLVSCNVVYNVGSKDESPALTGMAHLFEHYMFCGSKNIRYYDEKLQKIGAVNNAYTSQDLTHYYITLPYNNIETALWLESDRMLELAFLEETLAIQKNVVIEEFKENFINRPYGDMWTAFNDFFFEKHPYKWLPIGKEIGHIEKIIMDDVKQFFYRYYRPSNAILTIAGNVHAAELIPKVEKWFGDIPAGNPNRNTFPQESVIKKDVYETISRDVPSDMVTKGWLMCGRTAPDFYAFDLLSDLLGSGQSSYLYKHFVSDNAIFTDIFAYVTATTDPGIFVIGGRPVDRLSAEEADRLLSDYLHQFSFSSRLNHDLQKVKNKVESVLLANDLKIEDRASSLAIAECFSKVEDFENENEKYFSVSEDQLQAVAHRIFADSHCKTLYYKSL